MTGEYGESADGTPSMSAAEEHHGMRSPHNKESFWKRVWDFMGSENAKNLNRAIYNVVLLLAIYFLGANAMIWTVDQVKVYSDQLCDYSSFNRINTTLINVSSWSDSVVIQGG